MTQIPRHGPPVYTDYFEFFRAEAGEPLVEAFRIRYQVFCEERGFLSPQDYPEHLERDPYDATSLHLVGRHRFTRRAAGTARLVLSSPLGFPLQAHCRFDPDYPYLREPGHPATERFAEISRLAIAKTFRQRANDTIYGGPPRAYETPAPQSAGLRPPQAGHEIIAGLYKLIYQETKRAGLTHWLVAMEQGLQLLLKRIGCNFQPIGPEVDYYGPVTPYVLRVSEMEGHIYHRHRAIFDYWMEGLEPAYAPAAALLTTRPADDAALIETDGTIAQR